MKILLTGASGFVGSQVAAGLRAHRPDVTLFGLDNFARPGSPTNRETLRAHDVRLQHGDVRLASDIDALPAADWVIDAAANPSVLAGVDGQSSSRQVVEHNLLGTVNLLEYCRRHRAGFVLLSTSRVYSIPPLAGLAVAAAGARFVPRTDDPAHPLPAGLSARGVTEAFSTAAPVSLYGATKLASEQLALEYGAVFGFPVWINRCGVLAGAGQFGRPDQGILAYWLNAYLRRKPLRYIGFAGSGRQTRDAFHPRDLVGLLWRQLEAGHTPPRPGTPRLVNLGGGPENAFSLQELSAWCADRFGFAHPVAADPTPRAFDIPWMVMDFTLAAEAWGWKPGVGLAATLEEIARHAEQHPEWLELSAPFS